MIKRDLAILINKNIVLFYILLFLFIQSFSFNYTLHFEEFRDHIAYVSILEGKLPYLDFRWIYGPLGLFLNAFLFKIFGKELIVLRVSEIFLACIGILLVYRLSKFILPKKIAALCGFLSIALTYIVPSHTYNHYYGTLANLGASIMIFRFVRSSKLYNLFLAGLLASVSLLIHPLTFGAEMVLTVLIWLIILALVMKLNMARFFKSIFIFLFGASLFAMPIYLFILNKVPFRRVFELLWSHTEFLPIPWLGLSKVLSGHGFTFTLRSIRYILVMDFLNPFVACMEFVIIPAAAILLIIFWIKNKKDPKLILWISFLVILIYSHFGYYFYGGLGFPVSKFYTQYPVILFIFIVYRFYKWATSKNLRMLKVFIKLFCLFFTLIILFSYHSYKIKPFAMKGWAMFDMPSIRGISASDEDIRTYIEPSKYIRDNSVRGDKLFVTEYELGYYVLSGLPSIFPENAPAALIPYSMIVDSSFLSNYEGGPKRWEDVVIERLEKEKPKFIVKFDIKKHTYYQIASFKHGVGPKVEAYITNNYSILKRFPPLYAGNDLCIYKRNDA